jgi:acetyltransferase-like isoleucine patch superfamily enzyme
MEGRKQMRLLGFFLNWRMNHKVIKHRKYLNELALLGDNFCSSKAHPSHAVLNLKIENKSGDRSRIKIGHNCNLLGSIYCNLNGQIDIGDFVYMNGGGSIRTDHQLNIGSHCLIGPRVIIWDTDNHPLSVSKRHAQAERIPNEIISSYDADGGSIRIGNDVWLCMDSLILGGVEIGNGSIVSARSVVTKNVPPMSIVAGVPARVIGEVPE